MRLKNAIHANTHIREYPMLTLYIADVEKDVDMKNLSPKEAIAILSDMKIDIPVPKAAVTQRKRNTALDMAISALNCSEIPNNWIPCSERLPEINKEVLVTDGELCWVCSLFESQDIEDGLYQWEDNYGHWHEFETWVAWMPLPEPYQEDGE